ncbi:MAG TPA: glycosyltransferase [Pyrinomonadaceae bacterium]|jgi:hypothetical protein
MRRLASFQNYHQDQTLIVCGCGESLNELTQPERFVTVGVNDVGRRFTPDYLVVVNPREQFAGDRFRFVENSRAAYLFTQLELGVRHPHVVKFRLGSFGGTDFSEPDVLHYTNNSPYIALNLAILMGARRVGLIGVDFTEHHFFARTGAHPLAARFAAIDSQYRKMAEAAKARGVEIFNLSRRSRLTAFPKISAADFAAENRGSPKTKKHNSADSPPLKIVSYATTPVAGVPAILARCIDARTEHSARCVWLTNGYGNGVDFAGDVEWEKAPQTAENLLAEADLIVAHNGKVAAAHEKYLAGKPVVTMAHNYLWNVDDRFVKKGFAGVVVGQYQAALDEFRGWSVVPNPIPLWETCFRPAEKNAALTICYTPSGKHERYPKSHRLYWHSKGYETTVKILRRLARRFPIRLEIVGDRQISHAESLAMKRRAHIVIDECVTGSYHRNSLEGLACGAVVVNGLGIMPEVADVLRVCAPGARRLPFVAATLENLEEVLTELIASGQGKLLKAGAANRVWMEKHWDFSAQWEKFWRPALEKSMSRAKPRPAFKRFWKRAEITSEEVGKSAMEKYREGVSVVVPHGGKYRLPHLRASLANLRQCAAVGEVIVAEMDEDPHALETARRWADKYVFIEKNESFERARAINAGSAFAECEFVLWLDNDLLVPEDFLCSAVAEMRRGNLDFLLPFSEIKYLSFADSEMVMDGTLDPRDAAPIKVYTNRMTDGGAGLVRADFLRRFGGIPGGFRGWGGEDNAWMRKTKLLGKTARTDSQKTVFHLYHALSGGNGGDVHIKANPRYAKNVAALAKIARVSDPEEFLRRYPPEKVRLCDSRRRVLFIADREAENLSSIQSLQKALAEKFGIEAKIIDAPAAERELNACADAVVFFGQRTAREFLAREFFSPLIEKTILLALENDDLPPPETPKLAEIGAVLTRDEEKFAELISAVPQTALWKFEPQNPARALAQPLSIVLNRRKRRATSASAASGGARLPIWFYWEGKRPRWIEMCHRAILANAPNARFLTPESFAPLWTEDRDIDLSGLYVAHRADYIRAYLLAKFGGLWIDADCVPVVNLGFLLERLGEFDFIAHRERSGIFANCLIGAKKESRIAGEFYRRICEFLRAGSRISWLEIGSKPLTDILHATAAPFLELECERVQPVCWSQPEKFFAIGSDARHALNYDADAFCYMLSNGAVINYQRKHPDAELTAENTFFSYVVRRALGQNSPESGDRAKKREYHAAGGENRLTELNFYLEMMAKIAPRKVLDADVGSGRWAILLRDYFGPAADAPLDIEALVESEPENAEFLRAFYDRLHCGRFAERVAQIDDKKDLLILGDYLTRNGNSQRAETLAGALKIADYALLNFRRAENGRPPTGSERDLLDFLTANAARIAARRQSENAVAVLLSDADPKNIGRRGGDEFAAVFRRATEEHARQKLESLAGPGCSLKSTAEIRRALPLLVASLDVKSILDARCGDFNWQSALDLRAEKHWGVDVVPSLIEANRRKYENERRRFFVADVRRDVLPAAELVLCRDLTVHLSFEDVFAALRNFAANGAKYLLMTTFPEKKANADIQTGEWRPLNFERPPFNFGAPLKLINEKFHEGGARFADKSLGLWLVSDLRAIIGQ